MSRTPTQGWPVRYLANIPGQPLVGYNAARSDDDAHDQAHWTARQYGGRLEAEYADGSFEVIGDWSWKTRQRAVQGPTDECLAELGVPGFTSDPAT